MVKVCTDPWNKRIKTPVCSAAQQLSMIYLMAAKRNPEEMVVSALYSSTVKVVFFVGR